MFYKNSTKDDLPLKLSNSKIVNSVSKRQTSFNFLEVMLDENISWKKHIKTVENKLPKTLLCNESLKQLLDNESLKVYISFIFTLI